jgi:glyoxylase-like metal-dependent hydrolase (beta-lactamase superfamily II)
MKIIKHHRFFDVDAFEMGYMPIGKPLMTAYFFILDHLVIDTGIPHLRKEVLTILAEKHPAKALLTHCHEDHSGNAGAIKGGFGIDVLGHPYTALKMNQKLITLQYQKLVWGQAENVAVLPCPQSIETKNHTLKAIHTPGHSKDHTAYLDTQTGYLFSGDLYLADRIKIFRKDENIHDEIGSLKTILTHDFDALFCAHNPQLRNGRARIEAKLDFLENIVSEAREFNETGLPLREIVLKMRKSSDRFIRWFTMGNVCYGHMIRSALYDTPSA